MDNESRKFGHEAELNHSTEIIDTTRRAKNRTVLLSPDVTGEVRSRLIGSQPPEGEIDVPKALGPSVDADDDWGEVMQAADDVVAPEPETDTQDWVKPILVAPIQENNGDDEDEEEDHQAGQWSEPLHSHSEPEYVDEPVEQFEPEPVPIPVSRVAAAKPVPPILKVPTIPQKYQPIEEIYDEVVEEDPVSQMGAIEMMTYKTRTKLVGFLVTYDNDPLGVSVELHTGRITITSVAEGNENLFIVDDPTVSVRHAVMRVTDDAKIQILDQLSESGTRIVRGDSKEEILLSGEKSSLFGGDTVYFGERSFKVCLVSD